MSGAGPREGDAYPAGTGFGAAELIAGYRLEQRIGVGGMAVVFRARDERLGRLVALKILAPGLAADEQFRQRFVRESRAAAAVDDPHIIPVFEAGEAEGVLFIAMRYVPGGDVRSLVRHEAPLAPARAAAIISPVASALDAAHAADLVHRDVKPANMLLDRRPGRPDHVYLADFGLSKEHMSSGTLTMTGQSMGTPAYMAPEQIEGGPVDGRTDQYALACAAFELLAGEPPFERDQEKAVTFAQLSVPAPPLSSRRPGLPAEVDAVLARALARAPADRYPSCREFAEALRRALGLAPYDHDPGLPGASHPPTEIGGRAANGTPGGVPAGIPAGVAAAPRAEDPETVTSLPAPVGPGLGADAGYRGGDQAPPAPSRRRRRLPVVAGIAVVAAAAIVAAVVLPGSGTHKSPNHRPAPHAPASIVIAADSSDSPVGGYTYVEYLGGKYASARIHGEITGAASGEVAQLYAQPFPFNAAPTQVDAVLVHPSGKTADYAFQVTPAVATRYRVELFENSTAKSPFASSPISTVYVSTGGKVASDKTSKNCSPFCYTTVQLQVRIPASAMNTEISKKLYTYFGLNLSPNKTPPDPKWLFLGAGNPHVTTHRVSVTELDETITFSFRVGNDGASWDWNVCTQDTEAEDGIGLPGPPGYRGCGSGRISASAGYLG